MGKKKKEEVVDLKPEKISDEQLKELQNVISALNKLKFDIGTLEAQKHEGLHALFQGNDKLRDIQKSLQEQYGTADIDIQTGVVNYKEDEPSNS